MPMTRSVRRLMLTGHIGTSVALLGSVLVFLVLSIVGLASATMESVRSMYVAMAVTANLVVLPLALAALLTGLVEALGTPWGLFKHYWVTLKFALTGFATVVLLVKLELVSYAARLASQPEYSATDLRWAGTQLTAHAAGGLIVLMVPLWLSVYKPGGLTPYGRRALERPSVVRAPRSSLSLLLVRASPALIAVALALLFALLHLAARHFAGHGR